MFSCCTCVHFGDQTCMNVSLQLFRKTLTSLDSHQPSELKMTCICVCVCLRQVDRRADSPGTVGGPVSANGQETLNTRGYKPTHTLALCSLHFRTHPHNIYDSLTHTSILCFDKPWQAACSTLPGSMVGQNSARGRERKKAAFKRWPSCKGKVQGRTNNQWIKRMEEPLHLAQRLQIQFNIVWLELNPGNNGTFLTLWHSMCPCVYLRQTCTFCSVQLQTLMWRKILMHCSSGTTSLATNLRRQHDIKTKNNSADHNVGGS